jgi:hypothetical protein
MRKILQEHDGERGTYRGKFERFGVAGNSFGVKQTLVLCAIVDEAGVAVCDHLWFNLTKAFQALDLYPGDVVEFRGRVETYRKRGGHDYKLARPTQVNKVFDAKAARLLQQ